MKTSVITSFIALLLFSCTNGEGPKSQENKEPVKEIVPIDTTPRVTGIGGVFFFADSVKKTKEWYSANLGMKTDDYGSMFESRDIDRPEVIRKLQWSLFKTGNSYFKPSEKSFMVNYTVYNLEALLVKLKANGVIICDSMETYDIGKFVHIMDPEGNKIELWEPADKDPTKVADTTSK